MRYNSFVLLSSDVKGVGCWWDTNVRAIKSLEGQHPLLMDANYKTRENAIMKCAKAALDKKLQLFALQDGGMCMGDANALNTFDMYGFSSACWGNVWYFDI